MSPQEKKEEEKSFALHFIILSLLLIFFSVWVFWEEVATLRPWKTYQKEYYALKYKMTEEELEKAKKEFRRPQVQEEYQQLKSLLEEEKKEFNKADRQKEYNRLKDMHKKVEKEISSLQNDLLIARNKLLEEEYLYMKFKKEKSKKKREELEVKVRLLEDRKDELSQKKDDLEKKAESFTLPLERYAEKLKKFPYLSRIEELEKLLRSFENPKIEIKQYNIEDLNKVDRCTSCHIGIDNPIQSNYPSPYTTHPGYYIYLENHPPQQYGCTICHQGQGRATTSVEKAHGRVEFWEKPMFEGVYTQASCQHCHQDIAYLRGAEVMHEGNRLLEKSICFGCHRIDGYENIPKISPPLSRIGEKVNYTWLLKWLMNPSELMEGATMPNYFFSEEEARAMSDYLFSLSLGQRKDEAVNEDVNWDTYDKGKIVYSRSICSICHSANGRGGAYKDFYAPDLSRAGSKIKKEWLLKWLEDPKNYFKNERMPHYRFSDEEIQSLVEYIIGEYVDWDLEKEKMNQPEPLDESSVQRGGALIKEYGCFGCHVIEGMEDIPEIGPYLKIDELEEKVADELNSFGDKPVVEFDFGKQFEIVKTKKDYLKTKLETPRAFRDDAKMPHYNFSESEIEALATVVLGFSKEELSVKYRVEKKQDELQFTGEFAKIIDDVKCLNCHKFIRKGKDYAPDLSIEGSKVKEEWLRNYMKYPDIIRPLSEQMPRFNLGSVVHEVGYDLSKYEVEIIVDFFMTNLVTNKIPRNLLKEEDISHEDIEKGKEIYLEKGCHACHQIGEEGGAVGPPLTSAGLRLIPGYVYLYLLDPKIVGTKVVMPNLGLSKEEALNLTKFIMSLEGEGTK